jgi:hypothetical protein
VAASLGSPAWRGYEWVELTVSEFLDRILKEVRDRLEAGRAAVGEHQR